jgi:Tfp pilus assembly protein PilF/SAM-dependent methyltransferase
MTDLADVTAQGLIHEGLAHHRAGRLAQAEACYRKILAAEPANATALHLLGLLAHQTGHPQSAVALFTRAIAVDERSPELHTNLGNALHELGRLAEAEASFRRALAFAPDNVAAHNNLGVILMEQGRLGQAEESLRAAAALMPDHPDAHSNLASVLCAQGRPVEAEASCARALALREDHADAHNNLGNALKDQGRAEEAQASYRRAIALMPSFAEPYNNLGLTLEAQGRAAEAEHCYRRALELKPDHAEAHVNLGNLLIDRGDLAQALHVARQGLAIRETLELKGLFTRCLRHAGDNAVPATDARFRRDLLRALTEPWGRPADLAACPAAMLKQHPALGPAIARADAAWPNLLSTPALLGPTGTPKSGLPDFGHFFDETAATDDLLLCLLESTSVCDLALERFLTALRRLLLEAASADPDPDNPARLRLACALARQCFINEYIFAIAEAEAAELARLRETLAARLGCGDAIPPLQLAILGAYLPLGSLANAAALLDRAWPEPLAAVLTQQIREPLAEQAERATIARLTPIVDDVSRLVQQQYEENPYPRWVRTATMSRPTMPAAWLRRQLPGIASDLAIPEAAEILIAGCGTGQHSIETAQRFPAARILAIDLSLASLAYALRQSHALGLSNLEYAQADILQLGALGQNFDMIEAVGVLHHLADPLAGWRILAALLRPCSFMRLGLYSASARREITATRRFIARRGYGRTAGDIRRFRQDFLREEPSLAQKLAAQCRDFFSTSECRDLLFHHKEQRFTLPQIKTFLAEQKLTFLGFEIEGSTLQQFRRRFADRGALTDLDLWHAFEAESPDAFIGMYQFYVQKK